MDAKQIQAQAAAITKAAQQNLPSASLSTLLEPLKNAPMTEDILRSSKIGVIVNKFRQNKDPAIQTLAGELISKWKRDVEKAKGADGKHAAARRSPAIKGASPAVKSTNGTSSPAPSPAPQKPKAKSSIPPEKRSAAADKVDLRHTGVATRDSCLKLMYDGLVFMSEEAPDDVLEKAKAVEFAAFEKYKPETSEAYKNKMRSLFQNLKNKSNPQLRQRVMSGEITPNRFVVMTHDELKSAERKAEDERIAKENLDKAMVAKEERVYSETLECGRCKQKKVAYNQAQTRSADEPMTTFCECTNCGKKWKFS
ncbi:MAG: RNA polymerase II elongation factor [Bogoriella megaspora]|nr:MAG: RNA polymerase II elongation factor [Bogoriella megaspora]